MNLNVKKKIVRFHLEDAHYNNVRPHYYDKYKTSFKAHYGP
jgi:hypothetical protein